MPLSAPPQNLQQAKLSAAEYFKPPANLDEYDGKSDIMSNLSYVFSLLHSYW